MTLRIMTLSVKGLTVTLRINDTQQKQSAAYRQCYYAEPCYAECCYAECHYPECRGALHVIRPFRAQGGLSHGLSFKASTSAKPCC
jgi:hypothetical protein